MAPDLTNRQRAIVDNRGGALLVSAAAGSGKTTVLVERLMKYLTDEKDPANIDDFLIITFTNAAAAELRSKIATRLSELIAQYPGDRHLVRQLQRLYMAQISTVHAFCSNLVRRYAYRLDNSADFRLMDEEESAQLSQRIMEAVVEDAYDMLGTDDDIDDFYHSNGIKRNDSGIVTTLLSVYRASISHVDPKQWLDSSIPQSYQNVTDLSQTAWGKCLMDQIISRVAGQRQLLAHARDLASEMGFDAVQAYFDNIIAQTDRICACNSWDQLYLIGGVDWGTLKYPAKTPAEDKADISDLRDRAKNAINKAFTLCTGNTADILDSMLTVSGAIRGMVKLVNQYSDRYQQEKSRRRLLDYNDLEHRALDLLMGTRRTAPTNLSEEIGQRYREVMVDEYQDANAVQDCIYHALTHRRHNCFMVGDVKQSIYQFRLADPSLFLEKYKTFRNYDEVADDSPRKIVLGNNFRSGSQVIEAVNAVFRCCMSEKVGGLTYGKDEALCQLHETPPLAEPAVELHCLRTEGNHTQEEAVAIAQRIRHLLDGKHTIRTKDGERLIRGGDIAVLASSVKAIGPLLTRELAAWGIRCSGGRSNLLTAPEVMMLRDLLQVIQNPQLDIPLASILTSPVFHFTADDLAKIRCGKTDGSLYDSLAASDIPKAKAFMQTLRELRRKMRTISICELIDEIFDATGLDAVYHAMDGGDGRLENLNAFYQLALNYEQHGQQDIARFLDYLAMRDQKGVSVSTDSADPDCVQIMTIHASKGLEFPVVILANLSVQFNTNDLYAPVICHKELGIGMDIVDNVNRTKSASPAKLAVRSRCLQDMVSESMRLLYVAMTRAKERLIMYYSAKDVDSQLADICYMDNLGCSQQIIENTSCMGKWVLLSALRRTESGQLFAVAGPNRNAVVSRLPWKITLQGVEAVSGEVSVEEKPFDDAPMTEYLHRSAYIYPHSKATQTPSKRTATQLKGRLKDSESAENTARIPWKGPGGADYGTAVHKVMQMLDFSKTDSVAVIRDQLAQMQDKGLLTAEMAKLIDTEAICRFFATDVGRRLITHPDVLREFKFSILVDAQQFDPDLAGEQILLQGVVDCAMVDDDGITVIDFKTDRVTEQTVDQVAQSYEQQVRAYADAMSRIYDKPVKQALLYFFRLDQFVDIL